MLKGWKGKILRINLNSKKISKEELPGEWMLKYIGGRGINDIILYNEVGPNIDPFSRKNKLIFSVGPLEGTPIGMGKVSIQTKHPNRFIGEGGSGGHWGSAIKFAGYDVLIIEDKAESPVYILINDDHVEIRDARNLWGLSTREKIDKIQSGTNSYSVQVACIGQAGERLVAHSKIIFTYDHAGCRGCGTIMGDKKLAAIAVHGTGGVSIYDSERFLEYYRKFRKLLDLRETIDPYLPGYAFMSANQVLQNYNENGWLHAYNAQKGSIEGFLNGEEYIADYVTRPETSFCCPLPACGRRFEIKNGEYAGVSGDEREAGFVLAAAVAGINSWPVSLKFRDLCNKAGLDEFQAAYTIGWAMECYDKGIISKNDTDGIELVFGNEKAFLQVTEKIIRREGFGDILAKGSQEASKIIGKGSDRYLLTIKGRELEAMPQRATHQIALALAVSEGGPDHTRWYPPFPPNPKAISQNISLSFDPFKVFDSRSTEGKAQFVKWLYDSRAILESLPTCVFILRGTLSIDLRPWFDLYRACTGVDISYEEFTKIGERIVNLERAYIVREGFRRIHDTIPRRMIEEPILDRHIPPIGSNLQTMLDEYYKIRGWNVKTAIPKREKLEELDLDFVANDMAKLETENGSITKQ